MFKRRLRSISYLLRIQTQNVFLLTSFIRYGCLKDFLEASRIYWEYKQKMSFVDIFCTPWMSKKRFKNILCLLRVEESCLSMFKKKLSWAMRIVNLIAFNKCHFFLYIFIHFLIICNLTIESILAYHTELLQFGS